MTWGPLLESLARTGDPKPVPAGSPCGGERSSCRGACAAACPPRALRISGDQPEIGEGCDGCGLCASACPSASLRVPGVERALGAAVAEAGRWSCSAASSGKPSAKEGVLPCLGSLTPERVLLLAVRGGGTLHFKTGNCAECPMGVPSEPLRRRVLELAGLLREAAGREVLEVRQTVAGDEGGLPRRGFLRWMIHRPGASAVDALPSRTVLLQALHSLFPERSIPAGLEDHLRPLRLPAATASSCTLCGSCGLACASGALRLEATGRRICLRLDPDRCNGCGVCGEWCPEKAIALEGPKEVAPGPSILAEGPAARCVVCGRPSLKQDRGPTYCPACARWALRRGESPFAGYGRPDPRS